MLRDNAMGKPHADPGSGLFGGDIRLEELWFAISSGIPVPLSDAVMWAINPFTATRIVNCLPVQAWHPQRSK